MVIVCMRCPLTAPTLTISDRAALLAVSGRSSADRAVQPDDSQALLELGTEHSPVLGGGI